MYFFVGSNNPVKLNAAKQAGVAVWPDLVVCGVEVASGVAAQPKTDLETKRGAANRAVAALLQGRKSANIMENEEAIGIGLEGGVFEQDHELWSTVWVAVTAGDGEFYYANGARFKIPAAIAEPIKAGEEMGVVVGKLLQNPLVKQQQGMIGVVTNNFVDRTEEYSALAKLAIGLWYGRDWQLHTK